MDKLIVKGGRPLFGEVDISGAKNAAVAVLPAAILASKGVSVIDNIPDIQDVQGLLTLISSIGAKVKRENNSVIIDSTTITSETAVSSDGSKMRATYYLAGALLGRFKQAKVTFPGGCNIGVRPIDQHIKAFNALGANACVEHGYIVAKAEKLKGASIYFDVVSVGATINTMLAAVLAEGTTILENAAKEPHVVDVANFLNSMGANIKGAGTDVIRITGVKELRGCTYSVIPDQIEAGTFMIATAACGGKVTVNNVIPKHLESISAKLEEMGVKIKENNESIVVEKQGKLKGVNIKTLPYPGFPTDLQQPMCTLLSVTDGRSIINESIWESRFKYVDELKKMGANIKVEGRLAIIDGVNKLTGATVVATDLRAGAAMIIAGLIADGMTVITGVDHIDRGYPNIEKKFRKLGADITRISE